MIITFFIIQQNVHANISLVKVSAFQSSRMTKNGRCCAVAW